ncbi:hypothetical protein STRIP9103_02329 [Streptomyces ipomoeae 91-03]|uniref:Uncharacterized protein n=1 Tax=Streptomyces ipomoeae 91-03 TaxID=698759 RepID=L1KLW5_9ACTN|nr:hypothetical protein STRIP9103_02329 [Streptomyces ipomoeae 91-03]
MEHVQASGPGLGLGDGRGPLPRRDDVEGPVPCLPATCADLLGHAPGALGVHVGDQDGRSLRGQSAGGGRPDAGGGRGEQGRTAGETSRCGGDGHGIPPAPTSAPAPAGRAVEARGTNRGSVGTTTSPAGVPSMKATRASTAAVPSSCRGIATVISGGGGARPRAGRRCRPWRRLRGF